MALTALPTITSVAKTDTGSVTNITDSTVYGGSNPARNLNAVYLLAFKVDEFLVETGLTINTYAPATDTTYTITNTIDGYQKYVLFIVPNFNMGSTYAHYDLVYSSGIIYRSKSVSPLTGVLPTDTTNWEVITINIAYAAIGTSSASLNTVVGIVQTILTFASSQCLGDVASENAERNCCGECNDPRLQDKFERLWSLVYFANLASGRQKYIEGERFARDIDSYCDCTC